MSKNARNSKPIKNRKLFSNILTAFLIVADVLAIAFAGVLFYQKRYLTAFWVNGQSMYPTLNQNICDLEGNKYGRDGGEIHDPVVKNVDYGVMDCHKSAIDKIKRFDIVVCDYSVNDSSDKIKRVLGLPGETIKFVSSSDEHNGEFQVKDKNGVYQVIDQPISSEIIRAGIYSSTEYKLASDEYFVVGDNRYPGKSSDSRSVGAIKRNLIVGKVVAIVATCEAYLSDDDYDIRNINYYSWPRFL